MTTSERIDPAADRATSDPRDNTVTWWDIQVTDLEAAKTFYGTVFGWTYTEFGEGFVICHAETAA